MAQKTPRTGWLESIKGLFSWDPCQFHNWAFAKRSVEDLPARIEMDGQDSVFRGSAR